jgi:hypothetical protein
MATIQLLLAAEGSQPRPALIFRGAGRVKKREEHLYHPDVSVHFQGNAWLDEHVLEEWRTDVLAPFLRDERKGCQTVLFLENLKPQISPEFKR